MVTQQGDASFTIARLAELDSPVLQQFASALDLTPRKLDFAHDGRRWVGSVDRIARKSSLDLSILLVSPVDELLVEATAIRQELLLKTAVTIALIVPIVWLLAEYFTRRRRMIAPSITAAKLIVITSTCAGVWLRWMPRNPVRAAAGTMAKGSP